MLWTAVCSWQLLADVKEQRVALAKRPLQLDAQTMKARTEVLHELVGQTILRRIVSLNDFPSTLINALYR
jgi:hypothetical protein